MKKTKIEPGRFYSTPLSMHLEVALARKKNEDHLVAFKDQIERYHGRFYSAQKTTKANEWLENHYHDWLSFVVPSLGFNNPKVRVTATQAASTEVRAGASQHALNRWIHMTGLRGLLSSGPLVDMQFSYGVLRIGQAPHPHLRMPEALKQDDKDGDDDDDQVWIPYGERVPQKLFFEDALAVSRDRIRFQGHVTYADKVDLVERAKEHPEEGWNPKMVNGLPTSDTSDRLSRSQDKGETERNEVSFLEVYVPELELDAFPDGSPPPKGGWRKNGFNGTILTLPDVSPAEPHDDQLEVGSGDSWLRAPRPYYGHPRGPYVVFGVHTVPDETKFLSPFVVSEPQIRDLNKHIAVQSESAARYARMVIVAKLDPRSAELMKSGHHDGVIVIPGFERQHIQEVEKGGITEQMLAYAAQAKDRLNRNAHMDDARQGQAQRGVTATATATAAQASDTRLAWVEEQFVRGVTDFLERVLFLLVSDSRVALPLGSEAAEDLGFKDVQVPIDPEAEQVDGAPGAQIVRTDDGAYAVIPPEVWFRGGLDDAEHFWGLELSVEPYSMERVDDSAQRQNVLAAIQMTFSILPNVQLLQGAVKWKKILRDIGQAFSIPDWETRFDTDELLQVAQPDPTTPTLLGKTGQAMPSGPLERGMEKAVRMGLQSGAGPQMGNLASTAMPGSGGAQPGAATGQQSGRMAALGAGAGGQGA